MVVSVARSLEDALAGCDHLLPVRYAATIAAARQLAVRMDVLAEVGWMDPVSGKLDNVTVPTFLRYMEALGLTVTKAAPGAAVPPAPPAEDGGEPAGKAAAIVRLSDAARRKLS